MSCPVATMWWVKGLLCVVMETVTGLSGTGMCVVCPGRIKGGVKKACGQLSRVIRRA